jgi:hypothetical protein
MVYSEIESLARALPTTEKMRLAQVLMSDAAWSQTQPLELSEYPKSVELWSPFDELDAAKDMELHLDNATFELEQKNLRDLPVKPEQPVIYMDLREYLPVPPRPTTEELEKDDGALELEELQLMELAEEMAKRWAGMTIDLETSLRKPARTAGGD